MPNTKLMPQLHGPSLTTDETLACDRLLDELVAEFTGTTVRALDTRRPAAEAVVADRRVQVA